MGPWNVNLVLFKWTRGHGHQQTVEGEQRALNGVAQSIDQKRVCLCEDGVRGCEIQLRRHRLDGRILILTNFYYFLSTFSSA